MIPQSELIIEFGIGVEEKDRNESLSQKTEFKGKQSTVQYLFLCLMLQLLRVPHPYTDSAVSGRSYRKNPIKQPIVGCCSELRTLQGYKHYRDVPALLIFRSLSY